MAYTLGSKYAKNLCKRTVLVQLIMENVVTCFFEARCTFICHFKMSVLVMGKLIRIDSLSRIDLANY